MYIRELKNRSGSVSIQIIIKNQGRYKVVKTMGSATQWQKIEELKSLARQEIKKIEGQLSLFSSEKDEIIENAFSNLQNSNIRTVGPEIVFGRIYDFIGFGKIKEDMFRHLVISRLAFPLSKLKTAEYLYRYQGVSMNVDAIYRFLDKLNDKLKPEVEQIAYNHTKRVLGENLSVVFYDMTTLYFEASDEDDLRKKGFSKDGKHQCPQIFVGLLVGIGGYLIGYDIYEGNTYEGHTLIPFIEKISNKFSLGKPIVVADSGLLSKANIDSLEKQGYEYILGARLKNEPDKIRQLITEPTYVDGQSIIIEKDGGKHEKAEKKKRLIVNYSAKRAAKDAHNRKRGLDRLEKKIKSGRLTKASINNRGYNKYLKMEGEVSIEIDLDKYEQDACWDGLKGYLTNSKLDNDTIFENYKSLWHIEKAFRMSKTDLRIRPIYHRLRERIESHICIAFTAYCVYKELERVLTHCKSFLSIKKASEITHNMYQMDFVLPDSKEVKSVLLKMDVEQQHLYELILLNF